MRGGVTVRAQDLKTRLPEEMFGEIREMHPLLTPKLTNATIKRAVRDYLNGGAAESFNQPLNNWNVSNVEDMEGMFGNARSFNQPLNNWNVSNAWKIQTDPNFLPRTVNGTGHTGPSEFCATSI